MKVNRAAAYGVGVLLAFMTAGPIAAQIEIEFFERSVTIPATGAPLFLKDLATLGAHDPVTGVFDGGTALAPCCGNFRQINAEIGLSTDPNAITEGTQALNISMTNDNPGNQGTGNTAFDRPAILRIPSSDPRYAGLQTVALNPSNFAMNFDITLVADEIPDTFSTDDIAPNPFITIGFFGNSAGFVEPPSIRDFTSWNGAQLADMEAAGFDTRSLSFPASELSLPLAPTAYTIGFVFNGNWQLGERAAFNIDNWRFEELFGIASLDLNFDGAVNADDWGIFISNHLDPNADTFEKGDLDGDGDNDFDDFRFFEEGWNQLGAPIPFSDLIAGVPEPAAATLLLAAGLWLACAGRRPFLVKSSLVLLAGVLSITSSHCQAALSNTLLFGWETGLEGWEESGDNQYNGDPNFMLGNSTLGATQGSTQSFSLQQPLDEFNWGASTSIFANANFDAIESGLAIGAEHFVLEMDVTYDSPGSIPAGGSFANVSIRIQSSAGTSEVGGLANYDFTSSLQTISITQPLDRWTALPAQNGETGFYRFEIGLNGDWGFAPGTIYFDNLRLRQVSEPAVLTLQVDRNTGEVSFQNRSGVNGTGPDGLGGPVDLNYYQIVSASESLNPLGWNSLDTQNIDALDGADAGAVAGDNLLEGWDASGGVRGALAESFFLGRSDLLDTELMNLGNAFQVGGVEDLQFFYREPGRPDFLRSGIVSYVGVAPDNADFDADGDVDGTDFLIWNRGFNIGTTRAEGDANGSETVDAADLSIWDAQFGTDVGLLPGLASIPEPSAGILAMLGMGLCLGHKRRGQ